MYKNYNVYKDKRYKIKTTPLKMNISEPHFKNKPHATKGSTFLTKPL